MEVKKVLLLISGFLFLGFGIVGAFIPVLPTTPFVLLAAGCFGGSSQKIYLWLIKTKYFGSFIKNYKEKNGVSMKIKLRAIIFLWAGLIFSSIIFKKLYLWIILSIIGICVSIHILKISSKKE